ncbi:hypothetical protein B0181_07730 [Moraxella caviae]|uniref:Uncharacterized protein n=1 Tax=Moraxella caviae TaxID=34060 RepID=A0A1S9ZZF9_9GAMM|nr:hypothetical protein [Moraxella caviae]OOR88777.1 hypothetical protein B0181_07730 [Moraxella caviae]STZ14869.1 Uncharacterised protein [Moraxella caviae]VEW13662.1 Uncharacterised protein [Moraxella caviae]
MRLEYVLFAIVLLLFINSFSLKRQYQRLWLAMDKTKYIARYRELLAQKQNQAHAVKALRQEYPELGLMQAVEISQLAIQNTAKTDAANQAANQTNSQATSQNLDK